MLLSISSSMEAARAQAQSHKETLTNLILQRSNKTDAFLFPALHVSRVEGRLSRELPVISNMDLKNEKHAGADLQETPGKQRG